MSRSRKWKDEETALLIEFYGEFFTNLEKMSKKKPIYQQISVKLSEQGFVRDAGQVQKKISNLRDDYKKKKPGPTGDEKPDWIHYDALHKILHERPALNSDAAITSEIGLPTDETVANNSVNEDDASTVVSQGGESDREAEVEDSDGNVSILSVDEPTKKKRRVADQTVKLCAETLQFMKTQATKRDAEREEVRNTNASLVSALNRIASSSESIATSSATIAESVRQGNVTILTSQLNSELNE